MSDGCVVGSAALIADIASNTGGQSDPPACRHRINLCTGMFLVDKRIVGQSFQVREPSDGDLDNKIENA